jgi:chromosome segregation ATPase
MPVAELEERVAVLENQVRGLSEDVQRAKLTAQTCMGRQDFLADNLIEVRKTVTRIDQRVGQIDQRVEHIDQRVEHIEREQKEHGGLLRQILAKLG